jgi:plastocyanin
MPRRLPLLALICILPPAAAGCGGGDPVPVRNRTIGLKLDEYRIRPQEVSAPAGDLRLIVRNRGRLTHNVAVETIPSDPEDKPTVLFRTDTTHPGDRAETRFSLRPGHYRLVCTIANHSYLGQFGTLVVK